MLDPQSGIPIYLQLARSIAGEIQRGRLGPGTSLPGSRVMAETLSIHRNTVTAAYQELEAQGWVQSAASRGTFVSQRLPEAPAIGGRAIPAEPRYDLARPLWSLESPQIPAGALHFTDGTPDARLIPGAALSRAYRRALLKQAKRGLPYSSPQGHQSLLRAVAALLRAKRAVLASPEEVLITRGSQMALFLAAQALISPGDVVAVDQLGYRPAWEAFRLAGARLVSLPVDEGGMRVDELEALCARQKVRAVLVTPHHQYPTTVTMEAHRRMQLLQLALRHGIAVVEDDYDHEFHYEGKPILPLASADHNGVVVYIATFTKLLASGVRLGYVAGPKPLMERMMALRALVDRQGDAVLEAAVAELLDEGELQGHVRKVRQEYLRRRDALAESLHKSLGTRVNFVLPPGGMALWVRCVDTCTTSAWAEAGKKHGVYFAPGSTYTLDEICPAALRLGFASMTPEELAEGAKRMAAALAGLS